MKRRLISCVLLVSVLAMVGCAAHIHQVGSGSASGAEQQQRQWYILWGLVPLNDVDTNAMSGSASDYTIKTEQSALDVIINIFTGIITVNSRTVTVTK